MKPPKVFLLGLDGGTWKILDPLIKSGVTPNLGKLIKEGRDGILRSTIPYLTPVAWSTLLTGVNPAKHGIFGYSVVENREGMILGLLANRTRIKAPTVLDMYHEIGKKVISINMPMTYPPRPTDGIIITGLMTPSKESKFFSPPTLMDELKERGINYRIDIVIGEEPGNIEEKLEHYLSDGGKQFFDDMYDVTREREKAILWLLSEKPWDLFQVNFVTMDRIQHYFWNEVSDPNRTSTVKKRALEQYAYLDSIVGKIYSEIKDGAILVICSDHGFGDYKGNFYPAVWLKQQGYYSERERDLTFGLLVKSFLKRLKLSKKVLRLLEKSDKQFAKKLIYIGTSTVEWSRTRAYVYSTCGIRINLKGRDQFGIVEPGEEFEKLKQEIKTKLLDLRDDKGNKIMETVYLVDELYGSVDPETAPDMLYEFKDDHFYTTYYAITQAHSFLDRRHAWRQGDHRRDGIVILAGNGIAQGKRIIADIKDILPTVFYIQCVPHNKNFDGRILKEVFTDEFNSSRHSLGERRYGKGKGFQTEEAESDEVIERLKGLGYI